MTSTTFLRRGVFAAAIAIVALAALALSACGGSDNSKVQNTAALTGISFIDNAGFHDIDDQITQKQTVPPTAHTVALHIQAVALGTDWPSELKAPAKTVADRMGEFAVIIDTDNPDMKKAADASNKAHAAYHDFSNKVWAYLQKEAGMKVDSSGGHSD